MNGHWGNTYWPYFLCAVSVAFLVPEILGLISGGYNTLSEYAWRELHVSVAGIPFDKHSAAWLLSLGMTVLGTGWLIFHIWFRKFT